MRKLILLLALLLCPLSVNAAYWYEFAENSYIDLDSLQKNNNYSYAWIKLLNKGTFEPINNKKVWYGLNTIYVDLKNKKTAIKDMYFYDTDNKMLENYTVDSLIWEIIVPDSMAESLYEIVNKYPCLETPKDTPYWVNITEDTQIDINSLLLTNSNCINVWLNMDAKYLTDVKRKTKYVKSFLSVNLEERKAAVIEIKEYDKNNMILRHQKFSNLNYQAIGEDGVLNIAIDYILKLAESLEKGKTN